MPIISAQELRLTLQRTTYAPEETVQSYLIIPPDITLTNPLTTSQFTLTDITNKRYGVVQTLTQLSSKEYYHTFELPPHLPNGTYTLGFTTVYYTKEGKQHLQDISTTITITPSNTTLLLRPGFHYQRIDPLDQPTLTTTIANTGAAITLNITTNTHYLSVQPTSFTLPPHSQTTLTIRTRIASDTNASYKGIVHINGLQPYDLLVILKRKGTPPTYLLTDTATPLLNETPTPPTTTSNQEGLTFTLRQSINVTITPNELPLTGRILFKNTAQQPLTNLRFILSKGLDEIITLTETGIPSLGVDQEYGITITIHQNATKDYTGELRIVSQEGASLSMPVVVHIKTEMVPAELPINKTPVSPSTANHTITPAPKPNTRTTFIVIIILILALALAALIAYIIYQRGKPKPQTFEKMIEDAMKP